MFNLDEQRTSGSLGCAVKQKVSEGVGGRAS